MLDHVNSDPHVVQKIMDMSASVSKHCSHHATIATDVNFKMYTPCILLYTKSFSFLKG